jgi:hypothetical protein
MSNSVAKPAVAALRDLPVERVLGVSSVAAFLWLLAQDRIHPVMVYVVELYLAF